MAGREEARRSAAARRARRRARRSLRLLLALAAAVGFLAYLLPLWDAVLVAEAAHPLDRARAIRLARSLKADHDPDAVATRGSLSRLAVLAALPAPVRLSRPVPREGRRLDDPDASGGPPSPARRPDPSRSPPGR